MNPQLLKLSIVICSWNRGRLLAETVASLLACHRDGTFEAEIIVVDNASTDDTGSQMSPFVEAGSIRLLNELRPGLSFARNAGVSVSHGDWIIFLDDDVLLPEDFLNRYAAATTSAADFGFMAGPVLPSFDQPLRPWVRGVLDVHPWCFSALDLGNPSRPLEKDQFPFGANMALRADLARQYPFDTSLGFKHGSLISGEETALFKAIRSSGASGFWVADVPLRHRLPAERASMEYLLRRAVGQGKADAYSSKAAGVRYRWLFPSILRRTVAVCFALLRGRQEVGSHVIALAREIAQLIWSFRLRPMFRSV
jgi:glycosyltransferase involved in cell wall biosynthesis